MDYFSRQEHNLPMKKPKDLDELHLPADALDHRLALARTGEGKPAAGALLTRDEVRTRLRISAAHFSKIAAGKVRGLPKLASVPLGRRQMFVDTTVDRWIRDVEAKSCSTAR